MVRLQSSWTLGPVDADLAWRWIAKLGAQRAPAYSTLDARLAWQVARHLELAAVGQSLLSPHHLELGATSPVEVQRSFYADARWRW